MTTIYKYKLDVADWQAIQLPQGAIIRAIQFQRNVLCLWTEVNPSVLDAPLEARYFEVFGTGYEIPTGMGIERAYLATVQTQSGRLVWHVYERLGVI